MSQSSKQKPTPPLFEPISSSSRTSTRVAAAIRRIIIKGQLRPGEILPPERALAERFQVTRNTVREALRSLEQLRLVSIRQGSGIRVRDYLTSAGLELVADLLDSADSADLSLMTELAEARQVIGRAMDHFSIDRFSPEALPQLADVVAALTREVQKPTPDPRRLQELDFEVHNCLVKAGGNRALLLLHNSIRHIYRGVAPLFAPLVQDPAALLRSHQQLLQALERGDRRRAKAICTRNYEQGSKALAGVS